MFSNVYCSENSTHCVHCVPQRDLDTCRPSQVGQHEQTLLISALPLGSFLIRYWLCVQSCVELIGPCSFCKRDVSYPRSDIWELLQCLPVSLPTSPWGVISPTRNQGTVPSYFWLSECSYEPYYVDRDRVLMFACWVLLGNQVVAPFSRSPVLVSFTREEEQASGVLIALWAWTHGTFATLELFAPTMQFSSSFHWTPSQSAIPGDKCWVVCTWKMLDSFQIPDLEFTLDTSGLNSNRWIRDIELWSWHWFSYHLRILSKAILLFPEFKYKLVS